MNEHQKLYVVTKAGGCRSGSDRGGSVWHYVRGVATKNGGGKALCGDGPKIQWSTWEPAGQKVTCRKCEKLAQRERGVLEGMAMAAAIVARDRDNPVIARDIVDAAGIDGDNIACLDLPDYDKAPLHKLFRRHI